jgi:hypothetical protein
MQFAVNAAPARYDIRSHLTMSASTEGTIYRHTAAEYKVLSGRPTDIMVVQCLFFLYECICTLILEMVNCSFSINSVGIYVHNLQDVYIGVAYLMELSVVELCNVEFWDELVASG